MDLSIVIDNTKCERKQVSNIFEAAKLMQTNTVSSGVFKDNYRKSSNFQYTDFIALDVDGGCSVDKAKTIFSNYKYVILGTRNHNKAKDGVVAERFRVILELEKRIDNKEDYESTYSSLINEFPFVDPSCKDAARQFFSSPHLITQQEVGEPIKVKKWVKVEAPAVKVTSTEKGQLAKSTLEFIALGTTVNWNHRLFKAAKDIQEQGYTIEEAKSMLLVATRKEIGNLGRFDANDLKTINSAFNEQPKNPPRSEQKSFNFKNMKQLIEEKPKVDWYVDGFLATGAISIVAGQPKSGKSTIIRQLSATTARGGEFLGRKVAQGNVVYLALEEQESMIYDQFMALGVKENDNILFHAGPVGTTDGYEEIKQYLLDNRPRLLVIDTLVMFANILDQNNYKEVYSVITKYRNMARESGTHIVCIHHQNKSDIRGNNSVMGSGAFTGAVDTVIFFDEYNGKRFISSNQRGGIPFSRQSLVFNKEKQLYILGAPEDDGF